MSQPTIVTRVQREPAQPQALTPSIVVSDARRAMDWYVEVLGAQRRGELYVNADGTIGHAEVAIGDAVLMFSEASGLWPEVPVRAPDSPATFSHSLHLDVNDVDAATERARRGGAQVEREPADQPYGRSSVIVDPFGHRWILLRRPARVSGLRQGDVANVTMAARDADRAKDFYEAVLQVPFSPGHRGAWRTGETRPPLGILSSRGAEAGVQLCPTWSTTSRPRSSGYGRPAVRRTSQNPSPTGCWPSAPMTRARRSASGSLPTSRIARPRDPVAGQGCPAFTPHARLARVYVGEGDIEASQPSSVRGLRKSFGQKQAVAGIDLDVEAGSLTGLVGPNGAGKTTSLSMMTGLLRPDDGKVEVNGIDVWKDTRAAKAIIGVVPAESRAVRPAQWRGAAGIRRAGLHGLPGRGPLPRRSAAVGAGPDRGREAARRGLLHGHAQEGGARVRSYSQPLGAVPRRAARRGGPHLGRRDPPAADSLRALRLDRPVLQPRDGAGRAGLRPRLHHRQRPDRGRRHHRSGGRRQTLQQAVARHLSAGAMARRTAVVVRLLVHLKVRCPAQRAARVRPAPRCRSSSARSLRDCSR